MMNFFYQNVDKNGAKPHRSDDFSNGKTNIHMIRKNMGATVHLQLK
jgi:hypothetical protein